MSLDVTHELAQNFIDYAVAVNTDRSFPDARCGLKPVARRILYDAYYNGHTSNKPYVKNANIVGEVMAKFHPHGDTSIYGALVRLAQEWVLRYPLIDFHGNKGNIAGDPPAAYRYTEGRLGKITEDGMLFGIKKDTVDFMPNFDESIVEPETLPSIFPNLLCNPNTGIGIGIACDWAPHNLNEVAQAIYDYMDGKEPMLPGPDFPTGGIVINKSDIPNIMRTGKGTVRIRAKYEIKDREIIYSEIPYGFNTESILEEINALNASGEIEGISDIQDQSAKGKLRIVVFCDTNSNPATIVTKLFHKTHLQSSFSYNQVALVDKTPMLLNLTQCCEIYLQHNMQCLVREINFDLEASKTRVNIIEGLLVALEDIDNVIALIKAADDSSDAKNKLILKYHINEVQAKAILAMRLSSLAHLEKIELQNEYNDLLNKISEWEAIINSKDKQVAIIRERLQTLVKKYGDARRTELTQIEMPKGEDKQIEEVEPEKCVVVLTEGNTIKRIPTASFRTQRRAGKGVKTQEDITSMILRTNTIDSLMIFTNYGQMYRLLVDNIPVGTNSSKGIAITELVNMKDGEKAEVIYSIYRNTDAKYVLFTTKKGLVKKTALEEYIKTKKKTGIAAISLKEGDALANVCLIKDEPVIIVTKQGQVIRFKSEEIATSSRVTMGVKGILLAPDDEVVMTLAVRNDTDDLALFSSIGLGKRVSSHELVTQKRAGKGLSCYKVCDNAGYIVTAALVTNGDSILVVGDKSSICVAADDIPSLGRGSMGNILIKGTIKAVSKI